MVVIETFAFFDLETTGLPWQERNQTKIIELCILAVSRADLLRGSLDTRPPVKKLSFLLNPAPMRVNPEVVRMTGIDPKTLQSAPSFADMYPTLKKFLQSLPQPACLVAHNGNSFDYKIFKAEVKDAKRRLPSEILCMDSIVAFRKLDGTGLLNRSAPEADDWPDLNVSTQEWNDIDELCERLSDASTDPDSPRKPRGPVHVADHTYSKRVLFADEKKKPKAKPVKIVSKADPRKPFSLGSLYERLAQKELVNAHRAEADCLMLLDCVLATKHVFLPWADENCRLLSAMKALPRYQEISYRKSY